MKVKHRLPGVGAAAVEEIDTIGAEFGDHRVGRALRGQRHGGKVIGWYFDEIPAVPLGYHQNVTIGRWIDVHERKRRIVLYHCSTGHVAADDPAEQA